MQIEVPISKSIANRRLMLQAIHGDGLMPVSAVMPDDVRLLHGALTSILTKRGQGEVVLDLHNCGTAMRFLTAYCAQLAGCEVVLTGIERMKRRPMGQLVEVLRQLGADIICTEEEGFAPLQIRGRQLSIPAEGVRLDHPQSSQFVSALLLTGVPVTTDSRSPYIQMTQRLIADYTPTVTEIERDWSAAAFWYEYVALYGGEIVLEGLHKDSLQGDSAVSQLFSLLGVETTYAPHSITIARCTDGQPLPLEIGIDFTTIPDLYPAVALTCERLGVRLCASGTECLQWKESDRLDAVSHHRTDGDHRMAMALMVAGYEVSDTECINKSYPLFMSQLCKLRP